MVFELVHSVIGDGDIPVKKYKSTETGISVVVSQIPGPMVHSYITLATEAHDNLGIPHTLEHLIFMGSEDYPYKGVLDALATRCLSKGTNAQTDIDNTCYTLTTAGPDGTLNLLPIYLDHILYPTLKINSYITEVHHINEEGEDAGVVYCEMQGRENDGNELCSYKFLYEMYPGHCGYKSNTGGILKDIRESLNNKKIQDYHAALYRPENLCICIVGTISDEAVLAKVSQFETKIIEKRKKTPPEPFVRPWQSPVPPFTESVTKEVEFPSDDDENGISLVGWRGPCCITDFEASIAIGTLTDYLNDTAVSPLQQAFVEIDDPFCSDIYFYFIENSASCMYFMFDSIPKNKLNAIQSHLFELLNSIASSPETLDMTRMKDVIHRKKMQLLSSLESYPESHISSAVIGSFLYGTVESDLDVRLRQIPIIDGLAKKDANFWCDLLKKYFVSPPYVAIIGKPSPSLQKSLAKDEKSRIQAQREKLGSELATKAKEFEEAKALNDVPPPPEMLSQLPIPSLENIPYHSIRRLTAENTPEINNLVVPFKFLVDDAKTNFVTFSVLLNSAEGSSDGQNGLKYNLRLYLPLFCELVGESAINRNGTRIPYQDVVTQLATDSINSSLRFGIDDASFIQLIMLKLQVEKENYVKGINWLRDLIFETVFEEERVSVVVKRMLNDLALTKREGDYMAGDLVRHLAYDSRCNQWASVVHRKINFLKKVSSLLKKDPSSVINDLNRLKDYLCSSENMIIHVVMDIEKTVEANGNIDLYQPWMEVFLPSRVRQSMISGDLARPIIKTSELVVIPDSLEQRGLVAGIGSVDSNYMQTFIQFPISHLDPHLPAMLVLIEYLQLFEGPICRAVRGPGLAYGYGICLGVETNLLDFSLYRASHPDKAYTACKELVEKYCNNQVEWDQKILESCRSSLIFALIQKERNIQKVAASLLKNYLLNLDLNYSKDLIIKVSNITLEEIKKVAPILLRDLFNDEKTCKTVTCNTSKVAEVLDQFKKAGVTLRQIDLERDESFISKL